MVVEDMVVGDMVVGDMVKDISYSQLSRPKSA